jgi:hypothetical protein
MLNKKICLSCLKRHNVLAHFYYDECSHCIKGASCWSEGRREGLCKGFNNGDNQNGPECVLNRNLDHCMEFNHCLIVLMNDIYRYREITAENCKYYMEHVVSNKRGYKIR